MKIHLAFTLGSPAVARVPDVKRILSMVLVCGGLAASAVYADALEIDRARSSVEVSVKATVDSFTARLNTFDANIQVDDSPTGIAGAVFRFGFAELKTGKAERDRQMNEWEQSDVFPDAEFVLTHLTPGTEGHYLAHGTFRLHGQTRELSFPVAIVADNKLISIDGEVPLDTRDFGLPVIRKFVVLKVDPHVTVRFHLQGFRGKS